MTTPSNSTEYTAENILPNALKEKSLKVVSTLLRKPTLLAALALYNPTKVSDVYGVGNPEMNTITMGLANSEIKVQEADASGTYEPLIKNIIQHDFKRPDWRDTVATESVVGTAPTFTVAVDSNGTISSVTPSGGSGYSGAAPTLIAVTAIGTSGHGAVLTANMSGGTVNTVTVVSGGVGYTSSAAIVVYAGYSEGEQYARPIFHWSEIDTVGFIYDQDRDAAINLAKQKAQDEGEALLDLAGDAVVDEIAKQALTINADMWNGSPSSEASKLWSAQYGLLSAIDDGGTTATYAGVDRSATDGTTGWWRAITDGSTHNWGIDDFVDDANLNIGLSERSGGIDLGIVHPRLLAKWKKQTVAQLVNFNSDDRLRELGQFGFKSEVLKYGNTYVIGDPMCPLTTVLGVNTDSLLVRFRSGKKFQPSKMYDMRGTSGGKKGKKFHVETQWMFAVVAPNLNVKYTAVS